MSLDDKKAKYKALIDSYFNETGNPKDYSFKASLKRNIANIVKQLLEILIYYFAKYDEEYFHKRMDEHYIVVDKKTGNRWEFRTFRLMVKIGTLSEAIPVTVGFATQAGDLVENLVGNADILKSGKFQVIYDEKGVTYREKPNGVNIAGCSVSDNDQAFMNNNYEQLMTSTPKAMGIKKDASISNLAYGLYY